MSLRILLNSLIIAAVAAGVQPRTVLRAQDDSSSDEISFRRVYAPADRRKQWPLDNVRYLPVEAGEFERLVAAGTTSSGGKVSRANWTAARYSARLDGRELVDGKASLDMVNVGDDSALLPLSPCVLAVYEAVWNEDGETSPAKLGLDADGQLQVVAPKSSHLEFGWSLRGRGNNDGSVDFQIELPRCSNNRLDLDLPEGMTPISDAGIVTKGEAIAGQSSEEKSRRWTIQLGGNHRFRMQVAPAGAQTQRRQFAALRQATVYDFSLTGLEVSTRFNLEVHSGSLSQVTVDIDPRLRIIGAFYGEHPIPWLRSQSPDGKQATLVVDLPEPVSGTARVLRLRAVTPLLTDRDWYLPRIKPQNVFWQEGGMTMLVPDSLSVDQLETIGCRQSETGPLSAPRRGQSAQFQCFTPDAGLKVVIGRNRTTPRATSIAEIELSDAGMTGRAAADFSMSEGACFSLVAELDPRWLVDSVRSLPASAMDDWSLEKAGGNKQLLNVHLASAVSPARPVRIIVAARRLHSPVGVTLELDDLVPLKFVGCETNRRLLSVGTTSGFRLKVQPDDRLELIDADSLDESESGLFAEAPTDLLLVNNESARHLRVSLESRKPSFEGLIRVEAELTADTLRESYRIRCLPEAGGMNRLVVQFSRRRDAPLTWTPHKGPERRIQAKRLNIEEVAAADLPPAEETWELTFARSSGSFSEDRSFEIIGTREVENELPHTVSLAHLPEAGKQRGTLVVRGLGSRKARIAECRLKAIPPEIFDADDCETVPATYRYDPLSDTAPAPRPPLTLVADKDSPMSSAWAWECYLDSCYDPLGQGRHWLTYRLQNSGRARMALILPPEATVDDVRGAWVDGRPVAWRGSSEEASRDLIIELPVTKRFPTVSVCFVTTGSRLKTIGALDSPFPEIDIPVLSRHWTVWLPPGFEPTSPGLRWKYGTSRPGEIQTAGWSRRLFGLLGRSPAARPFDPLSPRDWTGPLQNRSKNVSAAKKVEQLLQLMGSLAVGDGGANGESGGTRATASWADLLQHESLASLEIVLLVDHQAMRQLGFTPRAELTKGDSPSRAASSQLPSLSANMPSDEGAAVLQAANLAILATDAAILLTGRTEASVNKESLAPLSKPGTWRVKPGLLGDKISEAAARPSPGFLAAGTWCEMPTTGTPRWERPVLPGHEPSDSYGWAAAHLDVSSSAPASLKFMHRKTMRLFGAITFLFVLAIGWWKAVDRPLLLVSLLGVFGVVAMLVPEVYIPVSSAAVLGVLGCLLLGLIIRRDSPPTETDTADSVTGPNVDDASGQRGSSNRTGIPSTTTAGIVSVLLVLCGLPVVAQDAPPEKTADEQPISSVFIPVDEKLYPNGDKYQVPAALYKQLHRQAAARDDKPRGWLLGAAKYWGKLSKDTATQQLVVDEFKAAFDLHVFGRSAQVVIPLDGKRSELLPGGILLDGQAVQPQWNDEGNALLVDVSGPGDYRLELSLQPTILGGSTSGFDLSTPRLATSSLELELPTDAPFVEVPSSSGVVRRQSDPMRLMAELGPADTLRVRWPETAGGNKAGPGVEVEELLWLNVQPGWVVLDTRFNFKIVNGQIEQVRLLGDQRLRMLPLKGEDAPSVEVRSLEDQSKEFQLKWPKPISGKTVVSAQFLVTGTSAVGNLRFPGVRVADVRSSRRFQAVSVDSNLEHEKQVTEGIEQLGIPEFMNLWGEAALQPKFAYRVVSEQPSWSMPTFPRQSRTSVRQDLTMSFGREHAEVRYHAELDTSAGVSFQYRLSVPREMKVQKVSLQQEGVECVRRWARDKSGLITAFLNGPTDGLQHLSLLGQLPVKINGQMKLPRLVVQGGLLESSTLELYRRPSVLVEVSRVEGLQPDEASQFVNRDIALGRLIGAFRQEGSSPGKATLTVSANEPKIAGSQITRLLCGGQSASATVGFQLSVSGGAADLFTLDISPNWTGPFQIHSSQPAALEVVDRADGRRQIVVRPEQAVSGGFDFSVAGPLADAPGSRVAAPTVSLRDLADFRHIVVLPTLDGSERIDWETRGLNGRELPPQVTATKPTDAPIAYETSGETFAATRLATGRKQLAARVRLADIRMNWQAEGSCSGVAMFYLTPGQSPHCPLWLPDGLELVSVKVCGVPTSPLSEPGKAAAWQVPLGPMNLPQRVEIVFTGKLPSPGTFGKQTLLVPRLGDIPADETLWTITSPPSVIAVSSAKSRPVAPWHHELARLRNTCSLITEASQTAADDQGDTLSWYTCWARRLVAERRALAGRMAETAGTADNGRMEEDLAAVGQLEQEQKEIADRLGLSLVLEELTAKDIAVNDAAQSWSSLLDRPLEVARLSFSGNVPAVTVAYSETESGWLSRRMGSASILVTLVVILGLALHRGLLGELFCRWPHLVGVLAGIVWWLWMWPSVLGLLIVAASLASLLRGGWKTTRQSRDALGHASADTPSSQG